MPNPLGRALRNRRAGQQTLAWAAPELQSATTFELRSPAFADGEPMPERFRGRFFGENLSPELAWGAPPAGTVELVLIVQDPDVPFSSPATHALVVGIDPALGGIPEGGLAHPSPIPGVRHGNGPLGRRGWAGPQPIPSHGPHFYVFQLFAADVAIDLPDRFSLTDVIRRLDGHVLGRARLDGTFETP